MLLLVALLFTLLAAVLCNKSSSYGLADPEHPDARMPHANLPPACLLDWPLESHVDWVMECIQRCFCNAVRNPAYLDVAKEKLLTLQYRNLEDTTLI